MPHSDAASRKVLIQQMMLAAYTGCRIGVRHDGYRQPGLKQDKYRKYNVRMKKYTILLYTITEDEL